MEYRYPLAADTFGPEEIDAAKAVLDSRQLTMGREVAAFENEFAEWVGCRHALMVNSGSSANLLMADALVRRSRTKPPLAAGDEVLVPGLSWPTTVWPLCQLGLVPVFVDIDPTTLAIDLENARSALSPRTRAMFLIHVLGQVPAMDEYVRFCQQHNLTLMEDTCESLGGHFSDRHAGTFGQMASFSFYFSHHISTIEGGMVITNDSALHDDLVSLRAHGWLRGRSDRAFWKGQNPELDERFFFVMGGYNLRPMELQAAVGRVQLRRLDVMLAARESLASQVHSWLERSAPYLHLFGAHQLPRADKAQTRRARTHSWMTLALRVDAKAPITLGDVKKHFEQHGVDTRPIIAGNLARHPATAAFVTRAASSLAQCDSLLKSGFMIGCHPVAAPGAIETLERAIAAFSQY